MHLLPQVLVFASLSASACAAGVTIAVNGSAQWRNISDVLYAAFIEDINHGVTGGLLAELISDPNAHGPAFVGQDAPRLSLQSVALPGFYLRWCSGSYILTRDGTGDATFVAAPGFTTPSGVALQTLSAPNTFSTAGDFISVTPQLGLVQRAADGSADFNASATFTFVPAGNGVVNIVNALNASASVWLQAGVNTDSGCSWIGDHFAVEVVTTPNPNAAAWMLSPPLQPSQAAWQLVNGSSSSVQGTFDTPTPALNANVSTALRLDVTGSGGAGVCNVGYYGMAVTAGQAFKLSAFVRAASASVSPLSVTLESASGDVTYATAIVDITSSVGVWQQYALQLNATSGDLNGTARLCVRTGGSGTLWLTAASLTPAATFAQRSNGMRDDLASMLGAMKPGALRFPGGCYVEGLNRSTAVNFTQGVGPIETRAGHYNLWQYDVSDRAGLFEYLQLAEDIGAAPVWVLNVGMYYGGGSDDVQSWIEHALASLEFAVADAASTYWGSVRAAMGHPVPFNVPFVAIGNENGGTTYVEHYVAMYAALAAAHPNITFIANANIAGQQGAVVDMYDYHTYPSTDWFYANQFMWDAVPRSPPPPRVFNSEYAAKVGAGRGNLAAAMSEAAWMMGLERNSDLVPLASYAPLFANTHDVDWLPDAIYFNSTSSYGSVSYWNQVLFGSTAVRGSVALGYNVSATPGDAACAGVGRSGFAAGTPLASDAGNLTVSALLQPNDTVLLRMVNYANCSRTVSIVLQQLPNGLQQPSTGQLQSITSASPEDENSMEAPTAVTIVASTVNTSPDAVLLLPPWSIHALRMQLVAA